MNNGRIIFYGYPNFRRGSCIHKKVNDKALVSQRIAEYKIIMLRGKVPACKSQDPRSS